MSESDNIIVEDKKEYKAEEFAKEYQALCDRMGWRIVVSPAWVSTNHGSFEMVQQYSVGKLPRVDNEKQ